MCTVIVCPASGNTVASPPPFCSLAKVGWWSAAASCAGGGKIWQFGTWGKQDAAAAKSLVSIGKL